MSDNDMANDQDQQLRSLKEHGRSISKTPAPLNSKGTNSLRKDKSLADLEEEKVP
jgi:hypothetical protein